MKNSNLRKVNNLWSIVLIELTNCCNFVCDFCPIYIMKRKKVMMKRDLWRKVLLEIKEKQMARTVFFHLVGRITSIRTLQGFFLNVLWINCLHPRRPIRVLI